VELMRVAEALRKDGKAAGEKADPKAGQKAATSPKRSPVARPKDAAGNSHRQRPQAWIDFKLSICRADFITYIHTYCNFRTFYVCMKVSFLNQYKNRHLSSFVHLCSKKCTCSLVAFWKC
jgi:hypothetical protein